LFVAGTLSMVALAMEQPIDLVSPAYYADSLKQDERMAAIAHVTALGAPVQAAVDAQARVIAIVIPPRAADGATGTVMLYRPSNATSDRTSPLVLDQTGVARVSTDGLTSGRWVLKMDWQAHATTYYFEQPITIP
jgi:nitrogen fixation protein FixH